MKTNWNKIEKTEEKLESTMINDDDKFLGELVIYCEVVNGGKDFYLAFKWDNEYTINNYPFPSLKYTKEFVEKYYNDIVKMAKHYRKFLKFSFTIGNMQEIGQIEMRGY